MPSEVAQAARVVLRRHRGTLLRVLEGVAEGSLEEDRGVLVQRAPPMGRLAQMASV